jgi:hypothetical protein
VPPLVFTPWDRRALVASATLTAVVLALTVLVTAMTDEGGVPFPERVSRAVPLTPVAAALATALTLAGAKRRLEARALEALGRSPAASSLAPALGAFGVGALVGAVVLLDARVSLRAFFPLVESAGPYTFDAGGFTNVRAGWRVMTDGSIALPLAGAPLHLDAPLVASPEHVFLRPCAALVTALGSAAFVATVVATLALRARWGWTALALVETAAATLFCLQAAAAGRAPLVLAPAPSTLLLLGATWAIVGRESREASNLPGRRGRRPT